MNERIILLICLILVACGNGELEIKLIEASKSGDVSAVHNLLSQGGNVNCRDGQGNSPLHYAVKAKHTEIVQLLLEKGAEVQKKNKKNETVLTIASSNDTVMTEILTGHIHNKAFSKAVGKNKIRDYVAFVRSYDDSRLVDNAVDSIYVLLVKKFPAEEYSNSISRDKFKSQLIDALQNNEPFLVAFAPKTVKGHMHWSWTTHFQEIAGVPVELYYMNPKIYSSKGHWTFRDSNGLLRKNIKINRFGTGSHRWWCTSSDFKGGSANLYYSGRYGDGQKKVHVTSYTKFPK